MRLTTDIRDNIATKLLTQRFADDVNNIRKQYAELATDIYKFALSDSERRRINRLPEGWVPTSTIMYVNIQGERESLHFSGYVTLNTRYVKVTNPEDVERRVPDAWGYHAPILVPTSSALSERRALLNNRLSDLKGDIQQTQAEVMALLKQSTTVKALVKKWPEVAAFTPKEDDIPATLPSVIVSQVNERLGLENVTI